MSTKKTLKKVPGLGVRSRVAGFRRAGRTWSKEEQLVPVSELSKPQIAALRAEPMLSVRDAEIEVETEEKA